MTEERKCYVDGNEVAANGDWIMIDGKWRHVYRTDKPNEAMHTPNFLKKPSQEKSVEEIVRDMIVEMRPHNQCTCPKCVTICSKALQAGRKKLENLTWFADKQHTLACDEMKKREEAEKEGDAWYKRAETYRERAEKAELLYTQENAEFKKAVGNLMKAEAELKILKENMGSDQMLSEVMYDMQQKLNEAEARVKELEKLIEWSGTERDSWLGSKDGKIKGEHWETLEGASERIQSLEKQLKEEKKQAYDYQVILCQDVTRLEKELEELEDLQTKTSRGAHKARVRCSELEAEVERLKQELNQWRYLKNADVADELQDKLDKAKVVLRKAKKIIVNDCSSYEPDMCGQHGSILEDILSEIGDDHES